LTRTAVSVLAPVERTSRTTSRAAAFSSGATASSRSATTASASEESAFSSLCSSLPGAKSSDRRWEMSAAVTLAPYVGHSQGAQAYAA
jgi:hypothetical protein